MSAISASPLVFVKSRMEFNILLTYKALQSCFKERIVPYHLSGGTSSPLEEPGLLWRNQLSSGGTSSPLEEPGPPLEEPGPPLEEPGLLWRNQVPLWRNQVPSGGTG